MIFLVALAFFILLALYSAVLLYDK